MTKATYRPVVGIHNAARDFRSANAPDNLPDASFGLPYPVKRIDQVVASGVWAALLEFMRRSKGG